MPEATISERLKKKKKKENSSTEKKAVISHIKYLQVETETMKSE